MDCLAQAIARRRAPRHPYDRTFLSLDEIRVKPILGYMFLPANQSKPSDYLGPEITDYGDLAELTAGLSQGSKSDFLWPRHDWTFSTP